MAHDVCPWYLGYLLASPLRRFFVGNPAAMLVPYVRAGMVVLEPGPGMGFFTVELARLVGPSGRVVAVDIQPKMLDGLKRRAGKAGVLDSIEPRLARSESMGIDDLAGSVDFVLAYAVVHEMPAADSFFAECSRVLKTGSCLLLAEPAGHVKPEEFEGELEVAAREGLNVVDRPSLRRSYSALLRKA
jgi:ubiquinone/menaquinone biosynthesis C-methylase UbiE